MSNSPTRSLIILHLTVFVWGFTGILGALITITEIPLVWYRLLIAVTSLGAYVYYKYKSFKINRQTAIKLLATGALVGLHWILFFGAIKASNVSVTMVCLSSLTLFTALLEPIINKSKISALEVFIGLLIIIGIYLIFKFESQYTKGIIMGLSSALCASLFSIINARAIKRTDATYIAFYELLGALFWVTIYLIISDGFGNQFKLSILDFAYLFILGTVCTSIAYVAGVSVMKELSAFRVALITNLEPVYAIILALIIFGSNEKMTTGFYLGASLILASIFLYPYLKKKF